MSLYTIARFIVLLRLSFCLFYVDNRLLHSFPTRRSSDLFAYTGPLRLLPAPEGAAAAPFQAMLASARREREAMEPAFEGRPLLVAASVDGYERLVVRVLRVSAGPPQFEEIALKFWSGSEAFC